VERKLKNELLLKVVGEHSLCFGGSSLKESWSLLEFAQLWISLNFFILFAKQSSPLILQLFAIEKPEAAFFPHFAVLSAKKVIHSKTSPPPPRAL
jgi:hypothetical protein